MKLFKVIVLGLCLFLLLFILCLYILGAARHVTDFEENTCQMTYMFEYPQYVKISLDNHLEDRYPRYGLYAYGEGYTTERIRRMHFTGIPVLFIPGNAGSHEQVRSLASVSLRKSLKDRTPFHFDFFAVSFGTEYSALYGGVLMDETHYVAHCIQKILSLYKGKVDSVILIGHSMGGLIAKGSIFLDPHLANTSSVSIILNLATPYTPSIILDSQILSYYSKVADARKNQLRGNMENSETAVVSIGGGPRDILVSSGQTYDPYSDINTLTMAIPDVWRSADHLSILWCKQFVLAVIRALFDCVDPTYTGVHPMKIFEKKEDKLKALEYHFYNRPSGKRLHIHRPRFQFESGAEWIEDIRRQFVWKNENKRERRTVYLMIRLTGQLDKLSVETFNLETKDWLFVCMANRIEGQSRVCEWGWNLTNRTRISPDYHYRLRKSVDLDLDEIRSTNDFTRMTHVIIRIPKEDMENDISVNVDIYSIKSRDYRIYGGSMLSNLIFKKKNEIIMDSGSVRGYTNLLNIRDVVNVQISPINCQSQDEKGYAMAELVEDGISTWIEFFTAVDDGPKKLKLQYTLPQLNKINKTLRLSFLNSKCAHKIKIEHGSLIDRLACAIRDRPHALHTSVISVLIFLVSTRISTNTSKNNMEDNHGKNKSDQKCIKNVDDKEDESKEDNKDDTDENNMCKVDSDDGNEDKNHKSDKNDNEADTDHTDKKDNDDINDDDKEDSNGTGDKESKGRKSYDDDSEIIDNNLSNDIIDANDSADNNHSNDNSEFEDNNDNLYISGKIHNVNENRSDRNIDNLVAIFVMVSLSVYFNLFVEFCAAAGLVFVAGFGVCVAVIVMGSIAHGIAVRFLARAITFSTTWSDYLLGTLHQLPCITTVILLSMIPATCASLTMLLSLFLSFLNLTKMYEDYLEELLMASLKNLNFSRGFNFFSNNRYFSFLYEDSSVSSRKRIFDTLILFLLWACAGLNGVPGVLVWAKNFSYDMRLQTEDPLLLQSFLILIACSTSGMLQLSSEKVTKSSNSRDTRDRRNRINSSYPKAIKDKAKQIVNTDETRVRTGETTSTRKLILTNALRLISWIVLSMGAVEYNPARYQCYIPAVVACVGVLIVLERAIPENVLN